MYSRCQDDSRSASSRAMASIGVIPVPPAIKTWLSLVGSISKVFDGELASREVPTAALSCSHRAAPLSRFFTPSRQ